MTARLLLHPFRLTVSGRVATAEQNTDTYIESQIAVVVSTRIGERDMCLPYGIPDPTYARLAVSDVQSCLDQFGPDGVVVTDVSVDPDTETTDRATIEWARA